MHKNLIAAIGVLSMLSISISAGPNTKKSLSVTPNNQGIKKGVAGGSENSGQKNAEFVPPAAAANAGVFDFEKIHDYKIDYGQHKGKVAPIYGLRVRIEEDSGEELKKMISLPKKEMADIHKLPKKEKKKKIAKFYKNLCEQVHENPKLRNLLYKQLENDSSIFYNIKNLCDPKCFDRDSANGFITGFYIPGANQNIDPIVLIHGGPGGNAVAMLDVAAKLSAETGRSVLAYTQRGCEGSGVSFDRGKDTFDQSSQDLDKIIDVTLALSGKKRVALVGHSFGPLIQNHYLSHNDEKKKVSASINVAPGPVDIEGRIISIIKRKESVIKLQNKFNKEKNPITYEYMKGNAELTQFYDWDKAKNSLQEFLKNDSICLTNQKASRFQTSMAVGFDNNWNLEMDFIKKMKKDECYEQGLKKITVPTLIVHGEGDSIPLTSSEKLEKLIPTSELHVMKDAAHSMFDEKPEEFYPLVKNFLDRVDAGKKIGTGKIKDLESVGKKVRIPQDQEGVPAA